MAGNLRLIPTDDGLEIFCKDYDSMKNMLFGEKIPFEEIVSTIKDYEAELNKVIRKQ